MSTDAPGATLTGALVGIDHIALPMQNTAETISFYRSLGLQVTENDYLVQVYFGRQMINFHRPETWQTKFSLRAPEAVPPCGDICLVWEGSADALTTLLDQAGIEVEEGPVDRDGGRQAPASSVYVRDPDGNLVEFMSYLEEDAHGS